jgi:hypothetical protein
MKISNIFGDPEIKKKKEKRKKETFRPLRDW